MWSLTVVAIALLGAATPQLAQEGVVIDTDECLLLPLQGKTALEPGSNSLLCARDAWSFNVVLLVGKW